MNVFSEVRFLHIPGPVLKISLDRSKFGSKIESKFNWQPKWPPQGLFDWSKNLLTAYARLSPFYSTSAAVKLVDSIAPKILTSTLSPECVSSQTATGARKCVHSSHSSSVEQGLAPLSECDADARGNKITHRWKPNLETCKYLAPISPEKSALAYLAEESV